MSSWRNTKIPEAAAPPFAPGKVDRVLGRYSCGLPGPTLVVTAGIHGNEPAGVYAVREVLRELAAGRIPLRGELVALSGNRPGLEAGERYLEEDLNRVWIEELIASANESAPKSIEAGERKELLKALEEIERNSDSRTVVLDFHTTSSPGPPFVVLSDTLPNRKLGLALKIPVILGFEETIQGTLLDYLTGRGFISMIVEGGGHQDPRSVEVLVSVLWKALEAQEMVSPQEIPDFERHAHRLALARERLPQFMGLTYRHGVEPEDAFVMRPGYRGFQPVESWEHLADDRYGEVRAPMEGFLLMPLYQQQGSDGFFLVQAVGRNWLRLSTLMRKLKLHLLARWLPGVKSVQGDRKTLVVERGLHRPFAEQLFHLLGYRKVSMTQDEFVFQRRDLSR